MFVTANMDFVYCLAVEKGCKGGFGGFIQGQVRVEVFSKNLLHGILFWNKI